MKVEWAYDPVASHMLSACLSAFSGTTTAHIDQVAAIESQEAGQVLLPASLDRLPSSNSQLLCNDGEGRTWYILDVP